MMPNRDTAGEGSDRNEGPSFSALATRPSRSADSSQLTRRRRKWHTRVFTGCGNCRRRHVKCDERQPFCGNCSRTAESCDYSQGIDTTTTKTAGVSRRFQFRAVEPPAKKCVSPTNLPNTPRHRHDSPLFLPPVPMPGLVSPETIYYDHFLGTVSAILIIFDTPANANPFRKLPQLTDASGLLHDTMVTLGAMHLARLPTLAKADRSGHHYAAVTTYGSVMERLRRALEKNAEGVSAVSPGPLLLLATTLLLCLFEMMHSDDATWQVHLSGARQIVEAMHSPRVAGSGAGTLVCSGHTGYSNDDDVGDADLVLPMHCFLISLLAYLDVAGACATGAGTLIPGSYWETLGGGWEFNLGSPSFRIGTGSNNSSRVSEDVVERELAQLRQAWSQLMLIQSDISALAKMGRVTNGGGRISDFSIRHATIARRIEAWHATTPAVFARIGKVSSLPDDTHSQDNDYELLTGAACVVCYAYGCSIYLDRVTTRRLHRAAVSPAVSAAVDRIISLSTRYASDEHRMGYLWTLFTAGTAAVSQEQQSVLRETLTSLKRFGFRNVSRALDILEYIWLQQRLFGEADYDTFDQLSARTLIP